MVTNLGLQFINIPVDRESPGLADFDSLASVKQTSAVGKTLVRRKLNFRASVFGCL